MAGPVWAETELRTIVAAAEGCRIPTNPNLAQPIDSLKAETGPS